MRCCCSIIPTMPRRQAAMDKFVQKMSKDIFSRGFYCAATISLLFIDCGSALQLPPWTYGETQHRKLNGCADCPWEVIAPIGADMSCFTCTSGKMPVACREATALASYSSAIEWYSFKFTMHVGNRSEGTKYNGGRLDLSRRVPLRHTIT